MLRYIGMQCVLECSVCLHISNYLYFRSFCSLLARQTIMVTVPDVEYHVTLRKCQLLQALWSIMAFLIKLSSKSMGLGQKLFFSMIKQFGYVFVSMLYNVHYNEHCMHYSLHLILYTTFTMVNIASNIHYNMDIVPFITMNIACNVHCNEHCMQHA